MGNIRKYSPHVRWSGDEIEIIRRLYPSAPHSEIIAALPHRSLRNIGCKANDLGITRISPPKMTLDEVRASKRAYMARRRAADPCAARAYQRKFHHKNRERQTKKMRDYALRRFFWNKANKLRGEHAANCQDLARLWKAQRGRCALTGRRLDRSAEPDHRTPKARGGNDSVENLQWVCREANRAKRDMTDDDFVALCGDVMRWIGMRMAMVDAVKEKAA